MRKHLVLLLLLITGLFVMPGHARHSPTDSTAVKAVIVEAWKVVLDKPEEAGSGQWKVTAHGTNTSGGTIYDCTATITLAGKGEVFPEAIQKKGDVSDQETVDAVWTVKTDGGDITVKFHGCPTRRPCN